MNVALVVRRLGTHGGTERFGVGLARRLVAAGHAVTCLCERVETPVPGVRVEPVRVAGRGRIARSLAFARAPRRIRGADLVVGLARAVGCDLLRAGGGCHEAWMPHVRWSLAEEVEREVDRRAVRSARVVVANSAMAAEQLHRHYGLPRHRLRVIRNGVDLDRFRPRPAARRPVPTVAFLGSGWRRKGLDTALRAIRGLPGVHLLVLGTDAHPARFRRMAERLGIAHRTHFLGAVPRPEDVLPEAWAAVLPTRYDSAANAVLEALACGLPAVTTARDGAAEVVPEPWMVVPDPESVEAVREALARALHEAAGGALGETCRGAAERWPAAATHDRVVRLVEALAGEGEA